MYKFKVNIEFHENNDRAGSELTYTEPIEINYNIEYGKLFIAEVFKELAYGRLGEVMMNCSMASGNLSYFDYILLENIFKLGERELVKELMEQFEIKTVMILDSSSDQQVAFFKNSN